MKFVNRHRSEVLSTLDRNGIPEQAVDFIKRRGRICIHHRASGQEFTYLRKKETKLDPITQQWQHTEWFKIKSGNSKELAVENWEMVMEAFDKWTKSVMD